MNPKTLALLIIIISGLLISPVSAAWANASCAITAKNSTGNISFNFTVNETLSCATGNYFNITSVTSDTNVSKNFSFDGRSNWSMSVRIILNNTDYSTNYSVKIFNASAAGNITYNATIRSNATGGIQFNMTLFNNTGYINFTKLPGTGSERSSNYVYVVGFAALVAAGAGIYLKRIKKV